MIVGERGAHQGAGSQVFATMTVKPKSLPLGTLVFTQQWRARLGDCFGYILWVCVPQVEWLFVHV